MDLKVYTLPIKRKIRKITNLILSIKSIRFVLLKLWNSKKINVGDTNKNFFLWGWMTVDIRDADYIVNFHNSNLPFKNDSIRYIYSSHMIEHISDSAVQQLFNESHRTLQKGGSFRIVCPDLDKIINAYKNKDYYFFLNYAQRLFSQIEKNIATNNDLFLHNNVIRTLASYIDTGLGPTVNLELFEEKFTKLNKYDFAAWCVSLLDQKQINNTSNLGHINAHDYNKILLMLKKAGFSNIYKSKIGQSKFKAFQHKKLDDPRKEWISLYVEAIK